MTAAERKAWNAAVEAAFELAAEDAAQWPHRASDYAEGAWDTAHRIAKRIRSLTKEGEDT